MENNRGDENDLYGWNEICEFLQMSPTTAIKVSKEYNPPIIKLGGTVYAQKSKLRIWMDDLFETQRYADVKKRKEKENG